MVGIALIPSRFACNENGLIVEACYFTNSIFPQGLSPSHNPVRIIKATAISLSAVQARTVAVHRPSVGLRTRIEYDEFCVVNACRP